MLTAWDALVLHVSANPRHLRLANALKTSQPTLKDAATVSFAVMNEVQKDWLLKNMARDILDFLCDKLNNNSLQLDVMVSEELPDDTKSRLYMPDEKFRFLTEKYPQVQQLRQAINLDVK